MTCLISGSSLLCLRWRRNFSPDQTMSCQMGFQFSHFLPVGNFLVTQLHVYIALLSFLMIAPWPPFAQNVLLYSVSDRRNTLLSCGLPESANCSINCPRWTFRCRKRTLYKCRKQWRGQLHLRKVLSHESTHWHDQTELHQPVTTAKPRLLDELDGQMDGRMDGWFWWWWWWWWWWCAPLLDLASLPNTPFHGSCGWLQSIFDSVVNLSPCKIKPPEGLVSSIYVWSKLSCFFTKVTIVSIALAFKVFPSAYLFFKAFAQVAFSMRLLPPQLLQQ